MPVAVRISPKHMSKEDYERVIAELKASGADQPSGRLFDAAYGNDEVHMFELWESQEHFDAHSESLFSALQSVGLDSGDVEVHALHSPRPD